jgi:threonine dehydrogenase-like Zn-dependent dehydrogenase
VPDPRIEEPNDAVIAGTSTAIWGSDLHLYGVLGPYLSAGDVLGHEAMGVVTEIGADITNLASGDRVVIPFNISCGHCWMCSRGLFAQCETTQVREQGKGVALFGYTSLYGSVSSASIRCPSAGPPRPGSEWRPWTRTRRWTPRARCKLAEVAQRATGLLPDSLAQKITDVAAADRLDALHVAVKAVRRGGTVSVSGVYGGEVDPMPMMEMFDRGV